MSRQDLRDIYFAARGWALAALFAGLVWMRAGSDAPLRPQYLFLVVGGLLLRFWAGGHLGTHGNGSRPEAPRLATTGPYALSRNPLYLSNLAIAAGLIFFANALAGKIAAAMLILLFAHHRALAKWEEARLRTLHGAVYGAYASRVPRWFSFRPPERDGEDGTGRAPLRAMLARQGRNLGYAVACVVILWIAARAH